MKGNITAIFKDAVFEAHFRASIVGRRYKVRYEPNNKLWEIKETHIAIWENR
jgi:hypothetical protein